MPACSLRSCGGPGKLYRFPNDETARQIWISFCNRDFKGTALLDKIAESVRSVLFQYFFYR